MNRSAFALIFLAWTLSSATAYGFQVPAGDRAIEISGRLEAGYAERVDRSTARENPGASLRLRIGADLLPWIRFESALTGVVGGAPRDTEGAGFFNFDKNLQDISPSGELEEAFLDFYLENVDVRLGIQKFSWGKLDGIQPNDILNPEKFYNFFLDDEIDRKVGIPAAAATFFLPDMPGRLGPKELRLTTVWAPIVTPFHFPDIDERWYPPLARVPRRSINNGFEVFQRTVFRNGDLPNRDLSHSGGAARLAGLFHGVDFALYFYEGFDTAPSFEATAQGFVTFRPQKAGCALSPSPGPECFDVLSEINVSPVFQRVRMIGADAAFNLHGVTFRAEGAFLKNRLYAKSIEKVVMSQQVDTTGVVFNPDVQQAVDVTIDQVNVRRDGVEWGIGADTFFYDTFFLVEMNQTVVLSNDVELLIGDHEMRLATTVRRNFLNDRLEAELIGLYGIQGVYGLGHGRVTYDLTDALDVRFGYLLIEGHRDSLVGQYKANDQAYCRFRFSF